MPHPLEVKYALPSKDILDIIARSPRCEQMVKGFVAECHLERMLKRVRSRGGIIDYERVDEDGRADFRVMAEGGPFLIECKMFMTRASRRSGYKVDFRKTRNSAGDRLSRFYRRSDFDILAACTFNQNGQWDFVFIRISDLPLDEDAGGDRLKKSVFYRPGQPHWAGTLSEVLGR